VTDSSGPFTANNGNLYDEACDYICDCVGHLATIKAITLSPDERETCTEQVADQLADATLYGVACDQLEARSFTANLTLVHLKTFYIQKLAVLIGDLGCRPFFTEIALRTHLSLAERQPPHTWPSPNERGIADFASADIGPLAWEFTDGVSASYHRGVRLHRDEQDGPALVITNADGKIIDEEYWRDGCLHRTDGPAKTVTDPVTGITQQSWMRDDRLTRADAPAYIERTASGRVLTEMWFIDGVFCRADGPAGIWRDNDGAGTWTMEQFSVDGVTVRAFENGVEVSYV
jgi:hypothetical protein